MAFDAAPSPPIAPPPRRERVFNAPVLVVGMALLLVGLHAAYSFLPFEAQLRLQFDYALVPRRFWEDGVFAKGYPDVGAALLTLLTTGFLHADWFHVLVNAFMLLAFGTPVARALGEGPGGWVVGWLRWLAVYLGSVIAGSATYLAINDVTAAAAVGASGGTSGLIAAAFLLDPAGRLTSPLSRGFLSMTAAFALVNVLLVFAGPMALGVGIAWEAHAGGYIAGALLMLALCRQRDPVETV